MELRGKKLFKSSLKLEPGVVTDQVLWLVERQGEKVKTEQVMGVAFVPLTRKKGP